jgi:hypothetical protein
MKIIALTAVLTLGCTLASAQQYKVLYEFGGSSNNDGASSEAPLIFDRSGNLYGTTAYGGDPSCTGNIPGCGTVFELSPGSDGPALNERGSNQLSLAMFIKRRVHVPTVGQRFTNCRIRDEVSVAYTS